MAAANNHNPCAFYSGNRDDTHATAAVLSLNILCSQNRCHPSGDFTHRAGQCSAAIREARNLVGNAGHTCLTQSFYLLRLRRTLRHMECGKQKLTFPEGHFQVSGHQILKLYDHIGLFIYFRHRIKHLRARSHIFLV